MKHLISFFVLLLAGSIVLADAKLTIEITQGVDDPTQIAVVPFDIKRGVNVDADIAQIIGQDLLRSGQFAPISRNNMLSLPHDVQDVFFRDWRAINANYVTVGRITANTDPEKIELHFSLVDVIRQEEVLNRTLIGYKNKPRALAHAASDAIYEQITGIQGAFSTRILYVSSDKNGEDFIYRLHMADTDGFNEKIIIESSEPVLSPAWSPDAKQIAYVSFEQGKPAIYRQILATAERQKLVDFPGLNGAPAWSPDGTHLAMVLSKDGNPDIYTLNLETKVLKKVVSHFAIDTEPTWMPDGKSLVFTSDRGGNPQIYQVSLETNRVKRITYEGTYNARPQILPDGSGFVVITRRAGNFHIALQKFNNDRIWILSQTALDESPTIAPNGFMLLYATKYNGQGILAAVSVDAGIKFRLPSSSTNVRDPAWSPL